MERVDKAVGEMTLNIFEQELIFEIFKNPVAIKAVVGRGETAPGYRTDVRYFVSKRPC